MRKRKIDTIRQKKLKAKMLANGGKHMGKAMEEAGYSKAYAKNPKKWLETEAGKDLVKWIDFEINEILKRMNDERWLADYKELADTLINLKKLQQLIQGEPTEISKINVSDEQYNEIIRRRAKEIGD